MNEIKLSDVIDHDLALKCGNDVADAMRRIYRLSESKRGCIMAGVAGASLAMASMAGAFWAGTDHPLDENALDDLWRELIRPMALTAIGKREGFEGLLAEIAAKDDRTPASQGGEHGG